MMRILTYMFFLLSIAQVNAQEPVKLTQCDSAIRFVARRRGGDYFMADQRISFDRVSDRLMMFPASASEFKSYKFRSNIGLISFYAGVGVFIAAEILQNTNRPLYNQNVMNLSVGYLATTAAGFTFLFASKKSFKRSMDYYNRQICSRPQP